MVKAISFFALAVCLCAASQCSAQDLPGVTITPTIRLSSEETANAKRITDQMRKAEDRTTVALANWQTFVKEFSQAHPQLGGAPHFSSDLATAYTVRDPRAPVAVATVVSLSAGELQKAEAAYNEIKSSYEARQQAEKGWDDFQTQFLLKHGVLRLSEASNQGGMATFANGEQYTIPYPWSNGIVLTPDFQTAIPR